MKILIGEITSYKSIVIARYLKEMYPGIIILGYDYKKFSKFTHTKYCDSFFLVEYPPKNKLKHIQSLSEIIHKQKVDHFIPVDSGMYGEYVKSKKLFGKAFSYIGEFINYDQLHNKSKSQQLAKKLSIRIPKIYQSINDSEIPFVVKPTNLSSSKSVKYIFSEKQRRKLILNSKNEYVFQEYIKGVGCGYSVFAKDGKLIVGYGHKRLAELPTTGGSSVYRDNYENKIMEDIAIKILKSTNWSGFAMFEFKLTPQNELVFIEINPRIWGSINQGLQNGINYFESFFGSVTLENNNIKTYLSPLIYLSILKYLINFNIKPLIIFLRNFKKNRPDVSLIDDPKGWLSTIFRKIL